MEIEKDPIYQGNNNLEHSETDMTDSLKVHDPVIKGNNAEIDIDLWNSWDESSCKLSYKLSLEAVDQNKINMSLAPTASTNGCAYNSVRLLMDTDPNDQIYGLGEQYTWFGLKGQSYPILVSEQGVGRGLEPVTTTLNTFKGGAGGSEVTTYQPKPLYATTSHTGFILNNSRVQIFDLTDNSLVNVLLHDTKFDSVLYNADTPLDLVAQMTSFTGRNPPVPEWARKGAIVGVEGGSDSVTKSVNKLLDAGVPIAGVWMQDWSGNHDYTEGTRVEWNWVLNRELYPEWDSMVADWKSKNIKPLIYINPYLQDMRTIKANVTRNLFEEAAEKGFLV